MTARTNLVASTGALGAHFSALTSEHNHAPPGRYGYESARSCLFALLVARRPSRVHVPNYVCSAVLQAIEAAGCAAQRYEIGPDFQSRGVELRADELLILVNYFGLCSEAVEAQLTAAPPDTVVVDNSQAYFQAPSKALATLYSPRKFLPCPDGGFIASEVDLRQDPADDGATMRRFDYLLRRVGAPPEPTRALYLSCERSLEAPSFNAMSDVTRAWIRAQDQGAIQVRRRANFEALAKRFPNNAFAFELGEQVPLCYPVAVEDGQALQRRLAAERIYCPRYWPEVVPANAFERTLIEGAIFLPIDHRYSIEDMNRLADAVAALEGDSRG